MGDAGKLCYKSGDGRLAFKAAGADAGKLVCKVDAGQLTAIAFAWPSSGKDLDICAFWTGASDMKVGFRYNSAAAVYTRGAYYIEYSGDKRGVDDSEWVRIKMSPWSGGERTFDVHLNFYEYDSVDYPASTCTVIAAQENGPSIISRDVGCGTTFHREALESDPGVRIAFDASGRLLSVTGI